MTNIECLQDISDWVNKKGENNLSIEWAIDQLRWRHVAEELPEDGAFVEWLFIAPDGVTNTTLMYWYDDMDRQSLNPHILYWRPIELPEGE